MFAVIKTGGKQYRVTAEATITVERLAGNVGDTIAFEDVLLFNDGSATHVGAPTVAGVTVAGTLVAQPRGEKVISFKKRRRQNSRRKKGHRQHLSQVKITEFLTGGRKPAANVAAPAPAPAPAVAAEPAPAPTAASSAAGESSAIAAAAAAGVAAAKAAGLDTQRFQKLEKAVGTADDLKLIGGIGPTIEKKLNTIGIWHFWQVAAMAQDDIDAVETEVGFKGRATRDQWKDQAVELMSGKGPRAKADQAAAAKKE